MTLRLIGAGFDRRYDADVEVTLREARIAKRVTRAGAVYDLILQFQRFHLRDGVPVSPPFADGSAHLRLGDDQVAAFLHGGATPGLYSLLAKWLQESENATVAPV